MFAEALLSAVDKPDIKKVESVVDQALIYAGMFPKRAHKTGISKHYYHDIGVTASVRLSITMQNYALLITRCMIEWEKISTTWFECWRL